MEPRVISHREVARDSYGIGRLSFACRRVEVEPKIGDKHQAPNQQCLRWLGISEGVIRLHTGFGK